MEACGLAHAFGLGIDVDVCQYHGFVVVLTSSRAFVYRVQFKDDYPRLLLERIMRYDGVELDYEEGEVRIIGTLDAVYRYPNPKVLLLTKSGPKVVIC